MPNLLPQIVITRGFSVSAERTIPYPWFQRITKAIFEVAIDPTFLLVEPFEMTIQRIVVALNSGSTLPCRRKSDFQSATYEQAVISIYGAPDIADFGR